MTIDSRSVSCTWIHWCPIVYPLSVISFVFLKIHSGEPKETRKTYHAEHDNCLDFYIMYVITIMIENYTMGPNSTSLFILTLRKLQTIRQQGNTYLLLPSILGPPLPSTGARVMTKVMRNEVCLKIYGRLKAGIFIFIFLI